jgi:hypothetical protein
MLSQLATQLHNRWIDLNAYPDMRPDYKVRQQIKRKHSDRPLYSSVEWHQRFWYPLGIKSRLSEFVYELLGECSGLDVGRMLPGDTLMVDLQLPLVCWFDWEMVWTDQFIDRFELEMDWMLDIGEFETLKDFMMKLDALVKG